MSLPVCVQGLLWYGAALWLWITLLWKQLNCKKEPWEASSGASTCAPCARWLRSSSPHHPLVHGPCPRSCRYAGPGLVRRWAWPCLQTCCMTMDLSGGWTWSLSLHLLCSSGLGPVGLSPLSVRPLSLPASSHSQLPARLPLWGSPLLPLLYITPITTLQLLCSTETEA